MSRPDDASHFREGLVGTQPWLRTLLDGLPIALALAEPGTARMFFANRAAHALAGGTFPTGVAAEDYDAVYECTDADGERIPAEQLPVVRAARGEDVDACALTWRTPAGPRPLLVSARMLPASDGRPATVVVTIDDVSSLRAADDARAEMLGHERAARAAAEAHDRLSAFLAEATTLVATSLDYRTTLRSLARLSVPRLGDWCVIDVVDDDGGLRRVAVAHADPRAGELADCVRAQGTDSEGRFGIRDVLRDGRSRLVSHAPPELAEGEPVDGPQARLLRTVGPTSYMVVPLLARGRTLGTMTIVAAESDRRFGPEDLTLATDLAHRVGQSIDNARLYRDAQESVAAQRRQAEQLGQLTDASLAIAAHRSVRDVLRAGAEHARALVDADVALARLADEVVLARGDRPGAWAADAEALAGGELGHLVGATNRSRRVDDAEAAAQPAWSAAPDGPPPGGWVGAPLVGRDGVNLGVLTVAGRARGEMTAADEAVIAQLAQIVSAAVENARLLEERGHIARTLQDSLLPSGLPDVPGVEVAARYRPAGRINEVGGDFYDVFALGPSSWAVVIGDVCGKGAEAAAVTALARYTLRATALIQPAPGRVLEALNTAMLAERADLRFCTAVFVRLDLAGGPGSGARVCATICSAGHPLPLLRPAAPALTARAVGHAGTLLGVVSELELAEDHVELGPGDALVLYTDGVTEAHAPDVVLDADALGARLAGVTTSAGELASRVEEIALGDAPGAARDDVAVLVARVREDDQAGGSPSPPSQARRVVGRAAG